MKRSKRRRGQVVLMFAVMLPVFLGFAGLAVDATYAFMLKSALVEATDAAALAGSRSIGNGATAVASAVDRTFYGNLPAGYLATGTATYSPNPAVITTTGSGYRSVTITSSAQSPTFLMRAFGIYTIPVAAQATASRRDLNAMIVVDRSGSLEQYHVWANVQTGVSCLVESLASCTAPPIFDGSSDRVGLVTFGTTSQVDVTPATNTLTTIASVINNHSLLSTGYHTTSALGLYLAYNALATLNDNTRQNIIVYFTDGVATGFPGQFNVYTSGMYKCTAPPPSGVPGIYGMPASGGSTFGLYQFAPPWSPSNTAAWTYLDASYVAGCTNSANVVSSFNPTWSPSGWGGAGAPPSISVYGAYTPVNLNNVNDQTTIDNISENMLLNVGTAARTDPLNITIFAVGLRESVTLPVSVQTLQRLANVSPYTVSGQPVGYAAWTSTGADLPAVFGQIASAVSHLTH